MNQMEVRNQKFDFNLLVLLMFFSLSGLFTLSDVESMVNEIIRMNEFHHPHVLPLIGVCVHGHWSWYFNGDAIHDQWESTRLFEEGTKQPGYHRG